MTETHNLGCFSPLGPSSEGGGLVPVLLPTARPCYAATVMSVGSTSALLRLRVAGLIAWVIGVQVSEAIATAGLIATAVSVLPELRRLPWRPWLPLAAWLTWALFVPWLSDAWPTGTGVARAFDWVALPIASFAVWSLPSRRGVVIALGVTLIVSCAAAGLQHLGWWPSQESLSFLSWTKLPLYRVYEPVPNAPGRFMGGGLIFHRLKFAHVSALAVLTLVIAGARAGKGRDRALSWAAAAIATISVWIFPHARMAAIALLGSLVVTVALLAPNRRLGLALAAAILLAGLSTVTFVDSVRERFVSALTTEGNGDRTELLASGLRAIESSPLTGVGLGQFKPAKFAEANTPQYVLDNPGKAHNQFISMAAEIGVPGAALFIVFLLTLVFRTWRSPEGVLTIAALALFVGLSMAHDPLFQPTFSMAVVLALGAGVREQQP